jgi:hypothetical protein
MSRKKYEARLTGDSVLVTRIQGNKVSQYMISPRDLFAGLQAFDTMGAFDIQKMPGNIRRVYLSDADVEAAERHFDDRSEKTTD